jgi:hypothetical protein
MPLAQRTGFVKKTAIVRDVKNVADAQWFLSSNIDTYIELFLMFS